jgi:predicted transcriptional regulator of viral defense system
MRLVEFIDFIVARGKCTFTLDEAEHMMGKSRRLVQVAINYSKKQGRIISPARGFYVIISPEYRIYGCLPAEYFIPYLMKYWNHNYYAGLLTAAAYHGASHQKPQIFQVITNKKHPAINCGKIRIIFIVKKDFDKAVTEKISTQKSILAISTPEQTALDLITYSNQSGGLNHIVTVLAELVEKINPAKFLELINKTPHNTWKQRLGYLFDYLGEEELANVCKNDLETRKRILHIPLFPNSKYKDSNFERNNKWKLIINAKIESDI